MGNMNDGNNPKTNGIIIGIDFGTSGLCFAYGYFNDNGKKEYHMGHFNDQGHYNKIKNEIILDDKLQNVLSFGNGCKSFLCTKHDFKFHHFKNIKMNLYSNLDTIKAINSGKEVDIVQIITLILIETKNKAIEQIRLSFPNLDEKKIHFVITVPAIYDLKSKNKMFKAAKNAGLIGNNDETSNFFALEPEAASIYFSSDNHDKMFYQQIIKDTKEKSFILCDYGSGTVDIVTQKKIFENNEFKFEELYPPVGDNLGANKINEYFIERVIKPLFGEENYEQIRRDLYESEDYELWVNFENAIENFKTNFNNKTEQLNKPYEIDCEFFKILNLDIDERISSFNSKNKWKLSNSKFNKFKIKFPFQIIYDFMHELISQVIELILPITETVKDLDTIIFTGGATKNRVILEIFENSYLKNFHTIRSSNPEVAIGIGSVLFSLSQNIITSRKAKYSFGIKVSVKWNDSLHSSGGEKSDDGLDCRNIFSKFITKGESLRSDEVIEKNYYMKSSIATILLYRTKEENVVFCDEKDEHNSLKVWNFGKYEINVGKDFDFNARKIKIRMKFGGTYIASEAIYCKTNKKVESKFLFE